MNKSPISTKFDKAHSIQKIGAHEEQNLRHRLSWYESHGSPDRKKIVHREHEKFRHNKIHEHLVDGVLSADADKQVTDNIMFVSPLNVKESNQRGSISSKLAESSKFMGAVKKLQEYDKHDRWGSGLNANTLMTEYRRKILFHALLDSGDVDESRDDSYEKVRRFIHVNHPQEMSEHDKIEMEKRIAETVMLEKQSKKRSLKDPEPLDKETDFQPKWDDYDVMKNRWRYIRPQLGSLTARNDLVPNSTSRKTLARTGHIVTGFVQDITRFENQMDNLQKRKTTKK